jgi:hypothetical protein
VSWGTAAGAARATVAKRDAMVMNCMVIDVESIETGLEGVDESVLK